MSLAAECECERVSTVATPPNLARGKPAAGPAHRLSVDLWGPVRAELRPDQAEASASAETIWRSKADNPPMVLRKTPHVMP